MRLSSSLPFVLIASLTGTAAAQNYSAYAWNESMSIAPKRITVNAYKAEDTVVASPLKATTYISFWQDAELYEGDTLSVRFGMTFDPDNGILAPLSTAIPTQNVPLAINNYQVDQVVQAPINLPAAYQKFGAWCQQPGTSYTIDGIIWTQLPTVMGGGNQPVHASAPLQIVVNCIDKKTAFKVDMTKLPKLIAPKINLKAKIVVPIKK